MNAVVFDLGGVLIDWDPRHLYRRLFDDGDEMERFLSEVVTSDWNAQQDAGRSFAEAVTTLAAEHPEQRELIEAFHLRWPETLGEALDGTVEVLRDVASAGVPVYALSNWSAETFPVARERYPFLAWFDGIVISGEEGVVKPDRRMFDRLVERFRLLPATTVFIDDRAENVAVADALGFTAILFVDAASLRRRLEELGVLA